MAEGHGVIVRIVCGGHLDAAGAKLRINKIVRDDGDRFVLERKQATTADEGRVAWVGWVYGDRFVPEHGLGSRGGDNHKLVGLGLPLGIQQRVFEMPKMALFL